MLCGINYNIPNNIDINPNYNKITEITSNGEDLTTNAFYVSNKTVWAKQ